MKNLVMGFLLVWLAGSASSMSAQAFPGFGNHDFFDDFPQDQVFTLSNGQEVKLPTHFNRAQGLNIMGSIDREFAEAYVDPELYEITTVPGNSRRAMVFITAILTEDHDFGPHNDFGLNILVTPKQKPIDERGPSSLVNTYAVAVSVYGDLEISNVADREIWAMKKEFSRFDVRQTGGRLNRHLMIGVSDDEGPWAEVDFEMPVLDIGVPLLMKTFVYSQTRPDLVAPVFFKGNFSLLPGDCHGTVQFHTAHSIGAWMNSMNFTPLLWQYSSHIQGAYLPPRQ